MSWASNWQEGLTPLDRESSRNNIFSSEEGDPSGDTVEKISLTNLTSQYCTKLYENETALLQRTYPDRFCEVWFDTVSCWPPTPFNQNASVRCFSELLNVKYNDTCKY